MLTTAEQIRKEKAKLEAAIAAIDKDIEGRERRITSLRGDRDQKHRRLLILEGQLQREEAEYRKPQGHCVEIVNERGETWRV